MLQPATDYATKADLALTEANLRSEMAGLRTEIRGLEASMERRMSEGFQQQTRTLMLTILGAVVVFVLTATVQGRFG